jgi:small subunit ribosomal protein S17
MPKRVLEGVVVSASQDKTVVVRVERTYTHGLYKKIVRRSKKYHAHDEANSTTIGARVSIRECKPRSKLKTWEIVSGEELAQAAEARRHAETGDRDVVAETAQGDDA